MINAQNPKTLLNLHTSRFLVVGLGTSGYWAARWLAQEGAKVTVTDIKDRSQLNVEFLKELEALGVTLETGGHRKESFLGVDAVVVSPGAPLNTPFIRAAMQKQIPVVGEMELAARYIEAPIIAVTGTNGKTTVTSFIGEMLESGEYDVFVGGNIGTPLSAYLARGKKADYLVVEVSSFQLDTIQSFCPEISLILNISPDHLDRYENYEAYIQSKLRIFENQGQGQTVILNADDPVLANVTPPDGTTLFRYGLKKAMGVDAHIVRENEFSAITGKNRFNLNTFSLSGSHNLENLLAVVLVARALNLSPETVKKTIDEFKGLPNRLERIGTNDPSPLLKGIQFYNDSKATNVDAAIRAVKSFDRPLILIAGGRHKGSDYQPLVQACKGNVKGAVFMGEAAGLLAQAFSDEIPYSLAHNMRDAVSRAFHLADSGDVVLLAPACSSFDMFENYDHRGRAFKAAVEEVLSGR
ncbi:MAG: UDP-N-acetylmuramoyl-L-alanine--D-glutamate ligase [Deltaproteobacteria bacterium]|nr:UDP-N-acetylmuramoyl-L-alanine--D-glutamate ligase [Deltaproteobacteria bacterium]